ncbi:MAG: hypothetical protein RLN62_05735 [Rickettsiales bacterium]
MPNGELQGNLLMLADDLLPEDGPVDATRVARTALFNGDDLSDEALIGLFYIFLVNYVEDGYRPNGLVKLDELIAEIREDLDPAVNIEDIQDVLGDIAMQGELVRLQVTFDYQDNFEADELGPALIGSVDSMLSR